MIETKYFRDYRAKIGFTNQGGAKAFFAAKDIIPTVDYSYIDLLNDRLFEIVAKINSIVPFETRLEEIDSFRAENIVGVFHKLRDFDIIHRLNNLGRRPEEVYFSWMRGYVVSSFFLKSLSEVFDVEMEDIVFIGDDELRNAETFKKTPKADLEISLVGDQKIRIEVQSGFQGINDIKQHKVLEAKKIKREQNISSLVIHFDLFNGQVAFVKLDSVDDDSVNWITRQQMEGQTVFNIDQNYFVWKLTETPPKYIELDL